MTVQDHFELDLAPTFPPSWTPDIPAAMATPPGSSCGSLDIIPAEIRQCIFKNVVPRNRIHMRAAPSYANGTIGHKTRVNYDVLLVCRSMNVEITPWFESAMKLITEETRLGTLPAPLSTKYLPRLTHLEIRAGYAISSKHLDLSCVPELTNIHLKWYPVRRALEGVLQYNDWGHPPRTHNLSNNMFLDGSWDAQIMENVRKSQGEAGIRSLMDATRAQGRTINFRTTIGDSWVENVSGVMENQRYRHVDGVFATYDNESYAITKRKIVEKMMDKEHSLVCVWQDGSLKTYISEGKLGHETKTLLEADTWTDALVAEWEWENPDRADASHGRWTEESEEASCEEDIDDEEDKSVSTGTDNDANELGSNSERESD